jgi:tetratricopeptide (TPR) repeat protein
LKTSTIKYILLGGFLVFLVACSTKKNSFISRKSHALSTKYNILYNGGLALDKGIVDLKSQYNDNFWDILSVERMQHLNDLQKPGEKKNTNFERAETKSVKAIQKHSMNIDGSEKNPQMDEAHLMLGKTRYYDQRYIPALEALNYVLYKYPESDKINEVKIWREKTNMRLENDELALNNLRKLLKGIKIKDQIFADANATLAQAFLNTTQKDSAVAKLKIASQFTKLDEEKARYKFIMGQIYDQLNYKDSAYSAFQDVIDMKRKSPKEYVIQAYAMQAKQFDYEKGDTLNFVKKYNKLLADRENRPYLDVLNHQMGLFYDKTKKSELAKKYYNISLKKKTQDNYLVASNYRNLGDIYFYDAKYTTAGKYYDSTLVVLDARSREFRAITKKRDNLEDVIKYEAIAKVNDSLLRISAMSNLDKEKYYQDYIESLKKEELKAKELDEKKAKDEKNDESLLGKAEAFVKEKSAVGKEILDETDQASSRKSSISQPKTLSPQGSVKSGDFYFYNPTTVAYGKTEFVKKWGKREHNSNWRISDTQEKNTSKDDDNDTSNNDTADKKSDKIDDKYTTSFYINKLPKNQKEIDSLVKERNFAYYQLGVIYKEKFKEYKLAADKFEKLLTYNPEERLILPSMYNLFKIYEIIDKDKALAMKNKIITQFPDSRYAQILSNNTTNSALTITPESAYDGLYKDFEKGLLRETYSKTGLAIDQYTGEDIIPKLELLKANLTGKLKGLTEYKKALNFVALTYPNTDEGKQTEKFLTTKIPMLEALYFNGEEPLSWKIIFQPQNSLDENSIKPLLEKLNKFVTERTVEKLIISNDIYTMEKNLILIHGIRNEESAKGIAQVLKDYKDYKIAEPSIVISNENYKIVQIYKNLDEYILGTGPTFETKKKPTIIDVKEPEKVKTEIVIPGLNPPKKEPKSDINDSDPIQNNPSGVPKAAEPKRASSPTPPGIIDKK